MWIPAYESVEAFGFLGYLLTTLPTAFCLVTYLGSNSSNILIFVILSNPFWSYPLTILSSNPTVVLSMGLNPVVGLLPITLMG